MINEEMLNEQAQQTFTLDRTNNSPSIEFRLRADGAVVYRYCVERGDYPSFVPPVSVPKSLRTVHKGLPAELRTELLDHYLE